MKAEKYSIKVFIAMTEFTKSRYSISYSSVPH